MIPKITVVLPVYNGADYIAQAIESVLNQTYTNIELFISDNNSDDETISIINTYKSSGRIRLVTHSENRGMLYNGNFCLENIDTEYFIPLCHDDFLYKDKALEMAAEILEVNKDIVAVYCSTMLVDYKGRPIMERKVNYRGRTDNNSVAKRSIVTGRNLFGNILLARTSAINKVRMSEGFHYTGDVEFSTALGYNKQVYFFEEALFALRLHVSNNTARKFDTIDEEFARIAIKHKVQLSATDRFMMKISHKSNYIKKSLFYFYLDKIRR